MSYIEALYIAILDRNPDTAGADNWLTELESGMTRETMHDAFINSPEFAARCQKFQVLSTPTEQSELTKFIEQLYVGILNRPSEEGGFTSWTNLYVSNRASISDIARSFFNSPEFLAHNFNNEDFVKQLYKGLLNREAEVDGLNSWRTNLDNGADSKVVIQAFLDSSEFKNRVKLGGMRL